jgi:TPR repeat protein
MGMRYFKTAIALAAAFVLSILPIASPANAAQSSSDDEAALQKSTEQCLLEKPEDGTAYCLQASVEAALLYADKCEAKDYDACVLYADNMATTNETRGDFTQIGVMLEDGCNALHAQSCSALGSVFATGWRGKSVMDLGPGLEKDFKNALFFSGKGCTLGNALACSDMGVLHYNGDGVEKNLSEAVRYFTKACEIRQGLDACSYRDLVAKELEGK